VVRVPGSNCDCGRTFDIYEGGIRGRVDDMKLVRGTNVYPRGRGGADPGARRDRRVPDPAVHGGRIRDEIEVLIEVPDPIVDVDALCARLSKELADAHETLRFGVRSVELGSLPRFELKAKRLIDERIVIGTEGERRSQ
jgi:phenylacetate-CoA ligase